MQLTATAGLGFLLAVLWFDLMFDTQVRTHSGARIPAEVLDSIAAYYRRVTTNARPMNLLVALVMLVTLAAVVGEIALGDADAPVALLVLALAATGIGLAAVRTVRDAQRLGAQQDTPGAQETLARSIYLDHVVCLFVILTALVLQIGFT